AITEHAFEVRQSSPRRRLREPPLKGGNVVVSRLQGRSHHLTETLHLDGADQDGKGGGTAAIYCEGEKHKKGG
ncbi:hypothetical protein A2U01_0099803, partial [Trifolium medium]|nr:hypothetical protein [Trifolium medium]